MIDAIDTAVDTLLTGVFQGTDFVAALSQKDIDGTLTDTDKADVDVAPLIAELSPDGGTQVGVGYQISIPPAADSPVFGQRYETRRPYGLTVTVIVRADRASPYVDLLKAAQALDDLTGRTVKGGRLEDEGETEQARDGTGNYVVGRAFSFSV